MIASLAVGNRPDEMNFVLVDYKGGAAFKDCNLLPHTVGMVTDLDGHLTTRALESLGRRAAPPRAPAGRRGRQGHRGLPRRRRRPSDAPMPRLLIVIDEFAALVAELPDFVTGLVDIARRGRSLGVHLILATQRPAGVVSAEIKSNTNLRIALRVTDAGDSRRRASRPPTPPRSPSPPRVVATPGSGTPASSRSSPPAWGAAPVVRTRAPSSTSGRSPSPTSAPRAHRPRRPRRTSRCRPTLPRSSRRPARRAAPRASSPRRARGCPP